MIAIDHLSKKFGKLQVLDDISLKFDRGHCIALIGPNGSGKTTLIKSILGMVLPDSGSISFRNVPVSKNYDYRQEIGYMPQIGRYPENMTIGQIFDMMKDIRKNSPVHDEDLLGSFQLNNLMSKRMRTLSGGTRQKVSACLAFLFKPQVLILDEPTAGLDPVSSEILKEKILLEKQNGKLILITSHVLSELDDMVSQVVYMQDGKVKFYKPLNQLREDTGEEKLSKAIARVMQED